MHFTAHLAQVSFEDYNCVTVDLLSTTLLVPAQLAIPPYQLTLVLYAWLVDTVLAKAKTKMTAQHGL